MFSRWLEILGVRQGDILADKYRIERVLGIGGMGIVVAAHHLQLDDRVAIKFLLPDAQANPEAVTRFRREARAAVKIKSEHVARIMDVGALIDGTPYMVMEYLEGADLAEWLLRGPLRIGEAIDFILQACEAIAEAHALGIVHRDLKPANLFAIRRPDGTPSIKVLDFGISKLEAGPSSSITQASALVGSPLYMSPEQAQSAKSADARSDIWSLGVILYELLTGAPPFRGGNMAELVDRITKASPPAMRDQRPEIPAGLETVVMKCLAKRREQRYPDIAALALALSPFGSARARQSAERVANILVAARAQSPRPAQPRDSRARPTLRWWPNASILNGRRAVRVGVGSAALLGAGVLLFWVRYEPVQPVGASETEILQSRGAIAPPAVPLPARPAPPPIAGAGVLPVPANTDGAKPARSVRPRLRIARPVQPPLPAPQPPQAMEPQTAIGPDSIAPRDASVNSAGDDLRRVKRPRRALDLEDPYQ